MMNNNLPLKSRNELVCLTEQIPGGKISVCVEHSDMPPQDLFAFAARNNPKRAFLFLSSVLGKHLPVTPAKIQDVHERLARKIPSLPGPVLFVGMAETATGLGQGVFEAWLRSHPTQAALYVHTTRYRVLGAEPLEFEESHSHAPRVFLHLPTSPHLRVLFEQARSVVLIDDEISTGNTFINLVRACRRFAPRIECLHLSSITDFRGAHRRTESEVHFGLPVTSGAIMEGTWSFTPNSLLQTGAPVAQAAHGFEAVLLDGGFGRVGRTTPLEIPTSLVRSLADKLVPGRETLVLGTGEFMHAGFVLGRALAAEAGAVVRVHATTRSPILAWGPVHHIESFKDNYDEGVPNYLYNVDLDRYGKIFLCHETAPSPSLHEIAGRLRACLVHFHSESKIEESPVC
jgi:Phosphoribosyl transferase/TRSP domain C terminus to PRTase_2